MWLVNVQKLNHSLYFSICLKYFITTYTFLCFGRMSCYYASHFLFVCLLFSPKVVAAVQHLLYFLFFYIYFWLCWVFVSVRGLSLVAASGGHSLSRCAGLSLSRPLLLRSTGSRRTGLVVVAHGPSCPAACGTFPDQGSNPCPLYWQADSQPLRHQGSPSIYFIHFEILHSEL